MDNVGFWTGYVVTMVVVLACLVAGLFYLGRTIYRTARRRTAGTTENERERKRRVAQRTGVFVILLGMVAMNLGGTAVAPIGGVITYFGAKQYREAGGQPQKVWQLVLALIVLFPVVVILIVTARVGIARLTHH
jgi:Ca2+/Na+ antiporter